MTGNATSADARTPVIVGVGQIVQRPTAGSETPGPLGPVELMVEAARAAADDAGASGLLARVGWIGVAGGWFAHRNPGALVADRIGASRAATALFGISGTAPQDLLAVAAERIAAGDLDVALVVGGEARWSQQRHERAGTTPAWVTEPGEGEPETRTMYPDEIYREAKIFGGAPPAYAVLEDSLRAAQGRDIDAHRDHIAALWADFARVGADNAFAWDRRGASAAAIREAAADNRMIAFPYTKAMVANNTVDMGSAVIVCSLEAARGAGVATDRLVFPQVIAESHETWIVAKRPVLHGTQALAAAGRSAYAHAGIGPDEIDHIDLYSCFPSIVQMSSAALELGTGRVSTLTGGLGFAGAPVGNAVGHSIAAMVQAVRTGGNGLVHGNGGMATKHSVAIYTNAPGRPFARIDLADELTLDEGAVADPSHAGAVTVEAATVVFDRNGPTRMVAAVRTAADARAWATSDDAAAMHLAMTEGVAGIRATRTADGLLQI